MKRSLRSRYSARNATTASGARGRCRRDAWLSEKVESIPEAFRKAQRRLSSTRLVVMRARTMRELRSRTPGPKRTKKNPDRMRVEEVRHQRQRASELDTLARLQAKYGKGD